MKTVGKGRVAWIPWDAAGLYYRHSLPAHAGLMANLVDHLLPGGRQLVTNAHPLVEMSLMKQGNRTLLAPHQHLRAFEHSVLPACADDRHPSDNPRSGQVCTRGSIRHSTSLAVASREDRDRAANA